MNKLFSTLAFALVASASLAGPGMAQSTTNDSDSDDFDASFQLQRLRDAGIAAVAVTDGGDNLLRVTVSQADGGQGFVLYDEDTLELLDDEATGSIQARRPAIVDRPPESLTHDADMVGHGDIQ
jgi:hypothetical protein